MSGGREVETEEEKDGRWEKRELILVGFWFGLVWVVGVDAKHGPIARPVFVSVDPARDDIPQVKAYVGGEFEEDEVSSRLLFLVLPSSLLLFLDNLRLSAPTILPSLLVELPPPLCLSTSPKSALLCSSRPRLDRI